MELQLFDSNDRFRCRINLAEPLWPLFRNSLREASLMSDAAATLDRDLEIDRAHLESLLRVLEPALRQHQARVLTKGHASGYDKVSIIVLGETMWVNARNPEHGKLMRVNRLYASLEEVFESSLRLRVFVVPDWNSHEYRLASLLKSAPNGVVKSDLQHLLQQSFEELQGAVTSEEVRSRLRRDAKALFDGHTIDESIAFLETWLLAHQTTIGTILPTKKLQLVLL